jgi:hypothetical protein
MLIVGEEIEPDISGCSNWSTTPFGDACEIVALLMGESTQSIKVRPRA